jgi:hypothetical protein
VISTRLISITFFSWLLCGVCFGQCPTLSVVGPPGVTNPGDKMTFRVDGGAVDLKYSWTVSAGTIVGGQATPAIFVATTADWQAVM